MSRVGFRESISRNERTTADVLLPSRNESGSGQAFEIPLCSVVGSRRLLTHMCAPGRRGLELGEAMRFRGKSIRRKIVALFARAAGFPDRDLGLRHGTHGARGQPAVRHDVHRPGDRLSDRGRHQRPAGRAPSDARLPRRPPGLRGTRRSAAHPDRHRRGRGRRSVGTPRTATYGTRWARRPPSGSTALLDAFDGVGPLRQTVEDGTVTREQALYLYNRLVDPCYTLLANLQVLDNVDVDKQGRALVNIVARPRAARP